MFVLFSDRINGEFSIQVLTTSSIHLEWPAVVSTAIHS